MVVATARAHRGLLERAQAGRRLARVEDLRAGAAHGGDERGGAGGDARQALQEVQRRALGREDRRGRRAHAQHHVARGYDLAIVDRPQFRLGRERRERGPGRRRTGDDTRCLGHDVRTASPRRIDRHPRGDVSVVAEVLAQRALDAFHELQVSQAHGAHATRRRGHGRTMSAREPTRRRRDYGGGSVGSGARWRASSCKVVRPMPSTCASSSRDAKAPCRTRCSTMARARNGPMPGNVANSATDAWLTSTRRGVATCRSSRRSACTTRAAKRTTAASVTSSQSPTSKRRRLGASPACRGATPAADAAGSAPASAPSARSPLTPCAGPAPPPSAAGAARSW